MSLVSYDRCLSCGSGWCLCPRGFRAPSGVLLGRAAWCARGRWPAREPSAPRASLGASPRSPARPRHRPPAPRPGPAFWLVISSSALLREALHWLVASAMPRYLVHRFLTQRIPTHAHGALSQPIRDRAEWVTAVASHQLALYQVTSCVLDRLFSYPERHNLSRTPFPIQFPGDATQSPDIRALPSASVATCSASVHRVVIWLARCSSFNWGQWGFCTT